MITDKKVVQLISYGINFLNISKKDYDALKEETKNLIKLNDIKVKFEEEK